MAIPWKDAVFGKVGTPPASGLRPCATALRFAMTARRASFEARQESAENPVSVDGLHHHTGRARGNPVR